MTRLIVTVEWVPITQAFPEAESIVLVSMGGGVVWPAYTDGKVWTDPTDGDDLAGVTHWCEFPMGVNP